MILVDHVSAFLCGWSGLAKHYPYSGGEPEGHLAPGTKVNGFGVVWLRVNVLPSGLLMFARSLFGDPFPPVLIPWSEIHDVSRSDLWGTARTSFHIGKPPIGKVRISSRWIKDAPFMK